MTAMFARLDPFMPVNQQLHRVVVEHEHEHALAEWTSTATTKSRRAYRNSYAAIFRVDGDLVLEVREYLDTDYAKRVLFDGDADIDPRTRLTERPKI